MSTPTVRTSTQVFVAALITMSATAQTPFGPALIPTPGLRPQEVAIGDIDGDGKNDIAATHETHVVTVHRGLGGGAFAAPVTLSIGTGTGFVGIEIVDVDGDLDRDVVALTGLWSAFATTYVWINQGSFTFGPLTSYASGIYTGGMALADVSGDGLLDLAVSNGGASSGVTLRLNTGGGVFGASQFLAVTGAVPRDVAIGDVEPDGDADIVTVNDNATLTVLPNQPGGFGAPMPNPLPSGGRKLELADFDNDGDLDAVVITSAHGVVPALNVGGGVFSPGTTIGNHISSLTALAVGDPDGDGWFDVGFADFQRNVHLLRNLGGGAFAPQEDYYAGTQYGVVFGDADGDARTDLIFARDQAHEIGILGGDGTGGFGGTRIVLGSGLRGFRRADLNGDGRLDLVGADGVPGVRVRLALPAGGFGTEATFPVAGGSIGVWVGRVDADTFLDVLVLCNDGGTLRALSGDGAGGFGAATTVQLSVMSLDAADFNADGFLDIVFNYSFWPPGWPVPVSAAYLQLNDGTGTFTPGADAQSQGGSQFAIGDMNADGAQDVVRYYGGQVTGWISNGAGGFVLQVYSTSASGAIVADLNEDGNLDVLQFGPTQLLPGDGLGNVGAPLAITGPVASIYRDVTGDGHLDGIAISNGIAVYERTAPLTYVDRGAVQNVGSSTATPTWADYDGDGRTDLWISTFTPSGVHVLRNRGPASGPVAYCVAKTTSNGCVPAIVWSGTPSATATSGFTISSTSSINNAPGLLAYSPSGRMNIPFQGGTLCIGPSIFRGPIQISGGNPGPMDCSGAYTLDFNAFAHGLAGGAPIPTLVVPGTAVTAQWYGRDAFSTGGASLSNAIDFVIGP